MRTLHACTEGLICSIITRRRHCKENKHTEADVARSRNNSSDDLLCTEQSKVRVVNLEHFPPPTADMHIYNCMLASTMHVWPAKQPLINKGLRQWLPSGVRNSSHRFSFSLTISLSIYSLSIYLSLSLSPSVSFFRSRSSASMAIKPIRIFDRISKRYTPMQQTLVCQEFAFRCRPRAATTHGHA